MKSRFDCFMQMPFRQFAVMFPDAVKEIPMLEIGYTEDAWEIN